MSLNDPVTGWDYTASMTNKWAYSASGMIMTWEERRITVSNETGTCAWLISYGLLKPQSCLIWLNYSAVYLEVRRKTPENSPTAVGIQLEICTSYFTNNEVKRQAVYVRTIKVHSCNNCCSRKEKKCYILWACVCSHWCPACNARAPY